MDVVNPALYFGGHRLVVLRQKTFDQFIDHLKDHLTLALRVWFLSFHTTLPC